MEKIKTAPWLVAGMLLLIAGQFLWIFSSPPTPDLTRIVSSYPIGNRSVVYEVESDKGGATVAKTYLYFIGNDYPDETTALKALKGHSPFLVTRYSGAIIAVNGLKITARTYDHVYRYTSRSLLQEEGEIKPVTIDLTATSD